MTRGTRHVMLGLWGMLAGAACAGPGAGATPSLGSAHGDSVRSGIDVLLEDSLHLVRGRRLSLLANHAAVDAHGVRDVDRLIGAGLSLVALFSPEHGFQGTADPGALVASSTDSATGLPIYSLYGRASAPMPAMLEQIDVMLVDLPDAGARYFTYLFSTVEVMRAAGPAGIPVIVLDRPDPISGLVQGNVRDPRDSASASSVGLLAVPMRHGLTLGEQARLAASDLRLRPPVVVPAQGWLRSQYLDETGLPFVPPSPNLRSLESLILYPGLCLVEGTNLSVGRGTDQPFTQVGAPCNDTTSVLSRLRAAGVPGVEFTATTFTPVRPGDAKYADTLLSGIRLRVTDRNVYDAPRAALSVLLPIRRTHPDRFQFLPAHFDRLAAGPALRRQIEANEPLARITSAWESGIQTFRRRVSPFLLYGPLGP